MVNETAPENSKSPKGIFVASPSMTWTLLPCKRDFSEQANERSISSAVSRATEVRNRSVVKPGPGPISRTFGPRSVSPIAHESRSATVRRQRSERHTHRCKRFIFPQEMLQVDFSLAIASCARLR